MGKTCIACVGFRKNGRWDELKCLDENSVVKCCFTTATDGKDFLTHGELDEGLTAKKFRTTRFFQSMNGHFFAVGRKLKSGSKSGQI